MIEPIAFNQRAPVARFKANLEGTDYVVGDIHGCFVMLESALDEIGFDPRRDRLFCTGDLVDRGPESALAGEWLDRPWFHACMGNHDAPVAFPRGKFYRMNLRCENNDPWFARLDDCRRYALTARFSHLPWAIEVAMPDGLPVGITHAEMPAEYDRWSDFTSALRNQAQALCFNTMWSRGIADFAQYHDAPSPFSQDEVDALWVPDLAHIFHGHTIAMDQRPYSVANRYFIDTGAFINTLAHHASHIGNACLSVFRLDRPAHPAARIRP